MTEINTRLEQFKADIFDRLLAIGIAPSLVAIEYQDDLQDYQVLISGERLVEDQLRAVLQNVAPLLHVEFDDVDNRFAYTRLQLRAHPSSGPVVIGGT